MADLPPTITPASGFGFVSPGPHCKHGNTPGCCPMCAAEVARQRIEADARAPLLAEIDRLKQERDAFRDLVKSGEELADIEERTAAADRAELLALLRRWLDAWADEGAMREEMLDILSSNTRDALAKADKPHDPTNAGQGLPG